MLNKSPSAATHPRFARRPRLRAARQYVNGFAGRSAAASRCLLTAYPAPKFASAVVDWTEVNRPRSDRGISATALARRNHAAAKRMCRGSARVDGLEMKDGRA